MPVFVIIRTATADDARAIAVVHVESWRAALRENDGHTLVAVDEPSAEVCGFVNVGPSRDDDTRADVGELRAIYLRAEWWRTGVGKQLHDAGIALLRDKHAYVEATLWVLDTNTRARAFYEAHGWSADGTTKNDDRHGITITEVRYRRALAT